MPLLALSFVSESVDLFLLGSLGAIGVLLGQVNFLLEVALS